MRIGISLATFPPDDATGLRAAAQQCERLGFDSIWIPDHVLWTFDRGFLDPIAEIGFLAGATERIGLGTSVLLTPYRNPILLANACASLDVLSRGRFTLGLGVGWSEKEFAALGVDYHRRGAITDAAIDTMQALWAGRAAEGTDLPLGTPPLTRGGPRLVIGGRSEAALGRAARLGAGWQGYQHFPEGVAAARDKLQQIDGGNRVELSDVVDVAPPQLASQAGSPERRTTEAAARVLGGPEPTLASIVDELGAMAAAGTALCVLRFPLKPALQGQAIDWAATELRSAMR